jgi:hypothetical protein
VPGATQIAQVRGDVTYGDRIRTGAPFSIAATTHSVSAMHTSAVGGVASRHASIAPVPPGAGTNSASTVGTVAVSGMLNASGTPMILSGAISLAVLSG